MLGKDGWGVFSQRFPCEGERGKHEMGLPGRQGAVNEMVVKTARSPRERGGAPSQGKVSHLL